MTTTRSQARLALTLSLPLLLLPGCDRPNEPSPAGPVPSASAPSAADPTATGDLVSAPSNGIRWAQFDGSQDVASSVRTALQRAHVEGRTLLVYVGAKWCEPCQRFHHAVDSGELDAAFPRLSILGFDADRDTEGLASAGYTSHLIPLFALPGGDGRASGKQIEGSVKGESAVGEITPRLRALLGDHGS